MSHAKAIVRTGACAEPWSPVLDGLARSFRVIAYDRRGFARSQTTKRWSFSDHARDVALLLEALKAAPATVVGWSGGGVVTLDLAAPSPSASAGWFWPSRGPPAHAPNALLARDGHSFRCP